MRGPRGDRPGRAGPGRRAAEAAFQQAHDIAAAAGLGAVAGAGAAGARHHRHVRHARRSIGSSTPGAMAIELGALATVAVVDLQLAAVYDERGELDLALAAALRGARRRPAGGGLATLPMSLGRAGAWCTPAAATGPRWSASIAAALATGEDVDYVEACGSGQRRCRSSTSWRAISSRRWSASTAAMEVLRRRPALADPVPRPVGAASARSSTTAATRPAPRSPALPFDTPVSRRMLAAADAVALGRAGDRRTRRRRASPRPTTWPEPASAAGSATRSSGSSSRRRPTATAGATRSPGCGSRCATFEAMGLDALAARCRDELLKELGAPVPRRSRAEAGHAGAAVARRPRHHRPRGRRARPRRRRRHQPRGGRAPLHLRAHRRQARRAPAAEDRRHEPRGLAAVAKRRRALRT